MANHKRVHRLYREAGLAVRKRRKRERVAVERCPLQVPSGPNHTWSMDFVFDALANGRPIKCLTVVDDCTKEAVEIAVARRTNGQGVADILETVCRFRGYPAMIRTDQGPEFTGRALDQWAVANGVKLLLIQPGSPPQKTLHRELQRQVPRRMLQRKLVHLTGACQGDDLCLATRLQ